MPLRPCTVAGRRSEFLESVVVVVAAVAGRKLCCSVPSGMSLATIEPGVRVYACWELTLASLFTARSRFTPSLNLELRLRGFTGTAAGSPSCKGCRGSVGVSRARGGVLREATPLAGGSPSVGTNPPLWC
jgi:hypothetical protein